MYWDQTIKVDQVDWAFSFSVQLFGKIFQATSNMTIRVWLIWLEFRKRENC